MSAGLSKARVVVVYDDGQVAEFNPRRPRLLLDFEDKFHVQAPDTHAQLFWMAHHALAQDTPFDEWVDGVDDVDWIEEDAQDEAGEGKADQS